jgi:Tfp pilus assembly protein PilF
MTPPNAQAALATLNGVRPVLAHLEAPRGGEDLAADIIDLWTGVEGSLRALIGGSALGGQQLVRAARQSELISLDQAHLLLEFLAARDRSNRTSYKPTQPDGDAALDGFRAYESALTGGAPVKRATPTTPQPPAYTPRPAPPAQPVSPYAPPPPGGYKPLGGYKAPAPYVPPAAAARPTTIEQPPPNFDSRRRRLPLWVMIGIPVLVLLLVIGGYFAFGRGGTSSGLTAGIDAMQAGQREKARGEFAKVARDDPNAATPHVFLARLAREEGDLNTARTELVAALRLEPTNAIALREMGLVVFSSKQYDLARAFFVRAVTANPGDSAARGYLGCAMMRLNRVQEGTNWISKAGSGPWTACLQPLTTTTPPPL